MDAVPDNLRYTSSYGDIEKVIPWAVYTNGRQLSDKRKRLNAKDGKCYYYKTPANNKAAKNQSKNTIKTPANNKAAKNQSKNTRKGRKAARNATYSVKTLLINHTA